MRQGINKIATGAREVVEGYLDEREYNKEHKQNLKIENNQLADLISKKGVLKDEYTEQQRRFVGRLFLVGYVDVDFENIEFNRAITQAELHDKQSENRSYDESMEYANSIYDEMLAITNSKATPIADVIIGNRNDNIGSYVVYNAGSRENLCKHDASFSKTSIALRDELVERGTNASLGNGIRKIMPFNDNHMHAIMSLVDTIQAGPPEKSNFAAVVIVDPSEPKNPYIPNQQQRSIAKDLQDGGVVQLQTNQVYGKPPLWVPVY